MYKYTQIYFLFFKNMGIYMDLPSHLHADYGIGRSQGRFRTMQGDITPNYGLKNVTIVPPF